jgi:bifunctional non-homologous end joining protein LigD
VVYLTAKDKTLVFVVQQHHATHMHWDFRLEMGGVLVSWAIPKGPSLNPNDKRLAIRVEDHNYSYKDFEGIITGDQYGAGKVIIWDTGTYEPVGFQTDENIHEVLLKEGKLEFTLYGVKLKGLWALFKTGSKRYGEDSWLMVKKKDEFVNTDTITKERPESVVSGKKVDEVTENDGCLACDTWD